ncbi:hypothetical protein CRG98_046310 [Punica granatum]|uniref:Uncharacterized protein n=1 Tax=Punica granatum TaxID=22663 RepID=A0A2I0HPV5_PUNGR|nr:hypothetical protein CRG98_046310 [Punica granatum]
MGHDAEFNMVCSNILSIKPFPMLNKVHSMVAHAESQKLVGRSHELGPEAAVFVARGSSSSGTGSVRQLQSSAEGRPGCDYCGKPGPCRNNCWALHGYPAGWEKGRGKKPVGK